MYYEIGPMYGSDTCIYTWIYLWSLEFWFVSMKYKFCLELLCGHMQHVPLSIPGYWKITVALQNEWIFFGWKSVKSLFLVDPIKMRPSGYSFKFSPYVYSKRVETQSQAGTRKYIAYIIKL